MLDTIVRGLQRPFVAAGKETVSVEASIGSYALLIATIALLRK